MDQWSDTLECARFAHRVYWVQFGFLEELRRKLGSKNDSVDLVKQNATYSWPY